MTTEKSFAPSFTRATESPMFEKRTVSELTESELMEIDGGTSPLVTSSTWCIAGSIFISGVVSGYILGH